MPGYTMVIMFNPEIWSLGLIYRMVVMTGTLHDSLVQGPL